jgi:Domain of unknown function (DUF4185)
MKLTLAAEKSVSKFEGSNYRKRGKSHLAAALVVLGVCGCSGRPNGGPPPDVSVTKATDLGPIPTNPDIVGRDGGYSALFQGFSVWLYGDTFLANPNAEGRTLISDSWSYTTDLNAQDGITGFQERLDSASAPAMILQETPTEQAFNQAHNGNPCQEQPCGARWALWPASIVVDPVSNQALVFYMVIFAQPGAFNFQGYGSSVATWPTFQGQPQRPAFNPPLVADHPDLMFGQSEPSFGTASLINNGTLYVYGCQFPDNAADEGCRLGKVDPGSVTDRSAWTFYAGNGNWSSSVGDALPVFIGSSIASVSWNNYLQLFVAIYSLPFSQHVMIRTAANPEGPWSAEAVAFTAMQPVSGNVYDAHAHSEYDANGGQTIFVSYSRATGTFSSEVRLVSLQLQTVQAK